MKAKIVIISIFFLLFACKEHQKAEHRGRKIDPHELDFQKDTLYFLWENYEEYNEYTNKVETIKPYYNRFDKTLAFGYPNGEYFLFKDGFISEKLKIKNLKNYHISPIEKVDSIHQSWHEKNKEVIKNEYSHWLRSDPPIINKDFAYVVYIIVISDNKKTFTIYPVIWDNQYYIE